MFPTPTMSPNPPKKSSSPPNSKNFPQQMLAFLDKFRYLWPNDTSGSNGRKAANFVTVYCNKMVYNELHNRGG